MKIKESQPLISIAARLVKLDALNELYEICENQESITTNKLHDIVDDAASKLRNEAVYIRNTFNKINS